MKVVVDSGVLIDWISGATTVQVARLTALKKVNRLVVGDLMIAEVLQGCDTDRDFNDARLLLASFDQIAISTPRLAVAAARNYRALRARGFTVRKTIDTLIATRCIVEGLPLLFSDCDFQPFVDHLGLRDAMTLPA